MRYGKEKEFDSVLKDLSERSFVFKKIYLLSHIIENWKIILNEDKRLAEVCQPSEYFEKEKLLIIACENNMAMQEVLFKRKVIIRKINAHFGTEMINEIKVIRRCFKKNDAGSI